VFTHVFFIDNVLKILIF